MVFYWLNVVRPIVSATNPGHPTLGRRMVATRIQHVKKFLFNFRNAAAWQAKAALAVPLICYGHSSFVHRAPSCTQKQRNIYAANIATRISSPLQPCLSSGHIECGEQSRIESFVQSLDSAKFSLRFSRFL